MTKQPKTAKTAISLPWDLLEQLRQREAAREIPSVSGHIQRLLMRERESADVEATLRRLFVSSRPDEEHRAWASSTLGLTAHP